MVIILFFLDLPIRARRDIQEESRRKIMIIWRKTHLLKKRKLCRVKEPRQRLWLFWQNIELLRTFSFI